MLKTYMNMFNMMTPTAYGKYLSKLVSATRYGMVHLLSGLLPLYTVNEYPKSGGTWLAQMLARSLDIPFPRNDFPILRSSVIQGHYLNRFGMANVVVVWRDGRDVMVSWYHHCLFFNDLANKSLVNEVRKDLSFEHYEDVMSNLPAFIEYSFTRQKHPRFSWADFVCKWYGHKNVIYVRYEDIYINTVSELQRVVKELTGKALSFEKAADIAEEFSFVRQSGRQPGVEDKGSFLRKGVIGDWHKYFNQQARIAFDKYAGSELISLGYEDDRTWVLLDHGDVPVD